jgi:hypothetical protein
VLEFLIASTCKELQNTNMLATVKSGVSISEMKRQFLGQERV